VACIVIGMASIFTLPLFQREQQYEQYDLYVMDGGTGDYIDRDCLHYNFFSATDPADFTTFDLLESGTSMYHITEGDFVDEDDHAFVVQYWGNDEAKIYPSRWDFLSPHHVNVLTTFSSPSSAGMNVMHAVTLDQVNMTAGILAGENITIMAATNASEPGSMFYAGMDYETGEMEGINFVVTFADDVTFNTFNIRQQQGGFNLSPMRLQMNVMQFSLNVLGPVPVALLGEWRNATCGNRITRIELTWHGTTWATCG
jgi:hypothetical protein